MAPPNSSFAFAGIFSTYEHTPVGIGMHRYGSGLCPRTGSVGHQLAERYQSV